MEQINENHRNQMLQSYNMIFVIESLNKLNDVSIQECYGCSSKSLVSWTPLTHLWTYFDEALEKVNMDIGMNKW